MNAQLVYEELYAQCSVKDIEVLEQLRLQTLRYYFDRKTHTICTTHDTIKQEQYLDEYDPFPNPYKMQYEELETYPSYIIAGQAIGSIISAQHNIIDSPVINDIDVFVVLPNIASSFTGEYTVAITQTERYEGLYSNASGSEYDAHTEAIIGVGRQERINHIIYSMFVRSDDDMTIPHMQNIVNAFDINCCKTGLAVDREGELQLYMSEDFQKFLRTRRIELVNMKTPFQSYMRCVKKQHELHLPFDKDYTIGMIELFYAYHALRSYRRLKSRDGIRWSFGKKVYDLMMTYSEAIPKEWKIEQLDLPSKLPIYTVVIDHILDDPVEYIAQKCDIPRTQFTQKDHIVQTIFEKFRACGTPKYRWFERCRMYRRGQSLFAHQIFPETYEYVVNREKRRKCVVFQDILKVQLGERDLTANEQLQQYAKWALRTNFTTISVLWRKPRFSSFYKNIETYFELVTKVIQDTTVRGIRRVLCTSPKLAQRDPYARLTITDFERLIGHSVFDMTTLRACMMEISEHWNELSWIYKDLTFSQIIQLFAALQQYIKKYSAAFTLGALHEYDKDVLLTSHKKLNHDVFKQRLEEQLREDTTQLGRILPQSLCTYNNVRFTQLCTKSTLLAEGWTMHHCVAGSVSDVQKGTLLVFHVEYKKETYTLGINYNQKRNIVNYYQCSGVNNKEVSKSCKTQIMNWLKDLNIRLTQETLKLSFVNQEQEQIAEQHQELIIDDIPF